jgi:hypothetical protein
MDAATKAQWESAISTLIALANRTNETQIDKMDPDARYRMKEHLESVIEAYEPDFESWPFVKDRYLYDIYLQSRADAGTLTAHDEIRAGLKIAQFSDPLAYHEHQRRISEHNVAEDDGRTKVCSRCGRERPLSKFRFRGGAKCNSCRAKEVRERKKAQPV